MTCRDRDQDLTLLLHGELKGIRGIWTAQHLSRCPRCQERQSQLANVSMLLADVIRDPDMPSRQAIRPPAGANKLGFAAKLFLAAVIFIVLASITIGIDLASGHDSAAAKHRVALPAAGCRPGLPNDHCQ